MCSKKNESAEAGEVGPHHTLQVWGCVKNKSLKNYGCGPSFDVVWQSGEMIHPSLASKLEMDTEKFASFEKGS